MIDGKFQKCAQLPHTSLYNELSTANKQRISPSRHASLLTEAPLTARDELHGARLEDQKARFETSGINGSRRKGPVYICVSYCILNNIK